MRFEDELISRSFAATKTDDAMRALLVAVLPSGDLMRRFVRSRWPWIERSMPSDARTTADASAWIVERMGSFDLICELVERHPSEMEGLFPGVAPPAEASPASAHPQNGGTMPKSSRLCLNETHGASGTRYMCARESGHDGDCDGGGLRWRGPKPAARPAASEICGSVMRDETGAGHQCRRAAGHDDACTDGMSFRWTNPRVSAECGGIAGVWDDGKRPKPPPAPADHSRALRIAARRAADAAELAALHTAYITLPLAFHPPPADDPDVATLAAGVRALALRIARRALRTKP